MFDSLTLPLTGAYAWLGTLLVLASVVLIAIDSRRRVRVA